MEWLKMETWSPYAVGIGIGIVCWLTFLFSNSRTGPVGKQSEGVPAQVKVDGVRWAVDLGPDEENCPRHARPDVRVGDLSVGAQQLVEVARYCRVNEVWWPLPLFILLLLIGFAAVLGQTVAPYIYTVF